jgi:hypothetical protein
VSTKFAALLSGRLPVQPQHLFTVSLFSLKLASGMGLQCLVWLFMHPVLEHPSIICQVSIFMQSKWAQRLRFIEIYHVTDSMFFALKLTGVSKGCKSIIVFIFQVTGSRLKCVSTPTELKPASPLKALVSAYNTSNCPVTRDNLVTQRPESYELLLRTLIESMKRTFVDLNDPQNMPDSY